MKDRGESQYIDVAGGYGILTRMMRDHGFNFFWQDKYCKNLFAQGLEYVPGELEYSGVTAFEVMEHLSNPVDFIKNIMLETGAETIIFSTLLYEEGVPDPNTWWYYTFDTGSHIGFFNKRTWKIIGEKLSLQFYSSNGIHVLTRKKLSKALLAIATNNIFSRIFSNLIQYRNKTRRRERVTSLNRTYPNT
jgi:2-polyprenyl-3-methyl-5-hydroxy-6-metoxy-1,4-benzoquinol methylase